MASINIMKARKDQAPSTVSLVVAIVILVSCILHLLAITVILCQKPEKLDQKSMIQQYGYVYSELDYKKPEKAKWALSVPVCYELRIFILAVTIIRLGDNLVVQILIFCLSSIFLMTLIGNVRPYTELYKNRMGMITEFVILLVIDCLLCSTNPGLDVSARGYLGWTVIAILSLVASY